MKKSILTFIITTAGLFSCKQSNNSKIDIIETKVSDSIKNINKKNTFNDKDIYTNYKYIDTDGKSVIIQNSFPKGGTKYSAPDGEVYYYAVFFTRIINETDNPLELKINFPADSYELPSLRGKYFKILLPPNKMTLDQEPLVNYGLKDLESFLDNNRHKSSSLKRTIDPKESTGFYTVKLNISTKSDWQSKGSTRAGFSLKDQTLYYKIKNDGSKTNSKSSDIEINCGSINLKNLILQK